MSDVLAPLVASSAVWESTSNIARELFPTATAFIRKITVSPRACRHAFGNTPGWTAITQEGFVAGGGQSVVMS